jgi:cyclase
LRKYSQRSVYAESRIRASIQILLSQIRSASLFAILLCSLIAAHPAASAAQTGQNRLAKETGDLLKVAEGVYAQTVSPDGNAVSNSGVVVLEHSVVVFDTHFTPEGGQALLLKIRALTPKPVRYVVDSHFHPDHTHGNQVFPGTVQIISSTNARRDILQKDQPALNRTLASVQAQLEKMRKATAVSEMEEVNGVDLGRQIKARQELLEKMSRLRIVVPLLTIDSRLSIIEEKREVVLLYIGIGHTDGDIILYLPAEKVVFLGDLFFNAAIPNVQDANLLEWMKTLDEILRLDAEKFIPGHGPVGTKQDVREFLGYFEELKAQVEPAVTRGDSMEQVLRDVQVPAKYASYNFQTFFPANVQEMYVELRAHQLASSSSNPPDGIKKEDAEKRKP